MHYRFVPLTLPALEALVARDLETAGAEVGLELTRFIDDHAWLWRIRLRQVRDDPSALPWIARPAVALTGPDAGALVGHLGFHEPPDDDGRVEVAYAVDPAYRQRGHATAMLGDALLRLHRHPDVHLVRASIAPTNGASLAVVARHGFVHLGEQWDDEDGLELVYERAV